MIFGILKFQFRIPISCQLQMRNNNVRQATLCFLFFYSSPYGWSLTLSRNWDLRIDPCPNWVILILDIRWYFCLLFCLGIIPCEQHKFSIFTRSLSFSLIMGDCFFLSNRLHIFEMLLQHGRLHFHIDNLLVDTMRCGSIGKLSSIWVDFNYNNSTGSTLCLGPSRHLSISWSHIQRVWRHLMVLYLF